MTTTTLKIFLVLMALTLAMMLIFSTIPVTNIFIRRHNMTLLSLFTTFKNSTDRVFMEVNTIRNWAEFLPFIQPILMTSYPHHPLAIQSRKHGWKVFHVSQANKYGTPHFKKLFSDVMDHTKHDSMFYGFCNGDILFNEGLLQTLQVVKEHAPNLTTPMLIGRRTNLNMSRIADPENFYHWSNVTQAKGELFLIQAIDYFIIANAQDFIWEKLKDVVIGRPGYDNYLVGMAIDHNVSVTDATKTIKAVHQTGLYRFEGIRNIDAEYNRHLIGGFTINRGVTTRAPYVTVRDKVHGIVLKRRNE